MTVIIYRKHTKETVYDSLQNDALSKAIHEQCKELELIKVFEGYVVAMQDKSTVQYSFDISERGYNRNTFLALKEGRITEIKLQLVAA